MTATHHSPQVRKESDKGTPIIDIALLPDSAFLREADLIRSKRGAYSILPFSGTSLWRMVGEGRFPKPVKLSERVTAWRVSDIRTWLNKCAEVA